VLLDHDHVVCPATWDLLDHEHLGAGIGVEFDQFSDDHDEPTFS
jgi:hypothetical protein